MAAADAGTFPALIAGDSFHFSITREELNDVVMVRFWKSGNA
jgi:hypothetical protein